MKAGICKNKTKLQKGFGVQMLKLQYLQLKDTGHEAVRTSENSKANSHLYCVAVCLYSSMINIGLNVGI